MLSAAADVLVGVVLVVLVTAATGWFVAQEFAYMAVDRNGLQAHAAEGDVAASRALQITSRTSFMLSGAQLGITVTGLVAGYVAEPMIGEGVSTLLGVEVPAGLGRAIGGAVALVVVTVIQMVFGELIAKNWAIARPEPVARWLALSTSAYLRVFGPVIRILDQAATGLVRAIRIEPVEDVRHAATPQDLQQIVAHSRETGDLPAELSTLLERSVDFADASAEHAMVPRTSVVTVPVNATAANALAVMGQGHSRIPVLGRSVDDVVGVLELRDLLALDPTERTTPAARLAREPVRIPTSTRLPRALALLRAAGDEFACVVDEYGGLAGVLTVEDLAEELVGEIADEHDHEPDADVRTVGDRTWLVPGQHGVDEVERLLEHSLPAGTYESIGGLVLDQLGRVPVPGDRVQLGLEQPVDATSDESAWTVELRVEVVDQHVPRTVRVSLRQQGREESASVSGDSHADERGAAP